MTPKQSNISQNKKGGITPKKSLLHNKPLVAGIAAVGLLIIIATSVAVYFFTSNWNTQNENSDNQTIVIGNDSLSEELEVPKNITVEPIQAEPHIDPWRNFKVGEGKYTPRILTSSETNESEFAEDGTLYQLSSSKYPELDGQFLAGKVDKAREGVEITEITSDKYWSPGACANLPSKVIDDRYIVTLEGMPFGGGFASNISDPLLVVFDSQTQEYIYLDHTNDRPNVAPFPTVLQYDSNHIATFFTDNEYIFDEEVVDGVTIRSATEKIIMRVTNITSYEYTDYSIPYVKKEAENIFGRSIPIAITQNKEIQFRVQDIYENENKALVFVGINQILTPSEIKQETKNQPEGVISEAGKTIYDPRSFTIVSEGQEYPLNLRRFVEPKISEITDTHILVSARFSGPEFLETNILRISKETKEVEIILDTSYVEEEFFSTPSASFVYLT